MYDYNEISWMEKELVDIGVVPLKTTTEVDNFFKIKDNISLIMINSVCGCATGSS